MTQEKTRESVIAEASRRETIDALGEALAAGYPPGEEIIIFYCPGGSERFQNVEQVRERLAEVKETP